MRYLRQVVYSLLALSVVASAASAQRPAARRPAPAPQHPWELGTDASLSFGLDDPRVTTLGIPVGSFRAGYHFSDAMSLEPFFAFDYVKVEGAPSFTTYQFGVGGLYHFSPLRTQQQFYVRPFLAIAGFSSAGPDNSDVGVGFGGGVKWPQLGGRLALRGEANIAAIGDNTSLNFMLGLSLFTR